MSSQKFATVDILRLEVGAPWPGLANIVPSPYPINAGVNSSSQWSAQSGEIVPRATGLGLSNPFGTVGALGVTGSIPLPLPATHLRAQIARVSGPNTVESRIVVTFLGNGGQDNVGTSFSTTRTTAGLSTLTVAIPVLATHVVIGLQLIKSGAGTVPEIVFGNVVAIAGSSAAVAASPMTVEPPWINVTGPTLDVEVERDELQVGILTANIADSGLDPARVDVVRPGRPVRLRALVGSAWEQIFRGSIRTGSATYDYTRTDTKSTRVAMVAVDPLTRLAGTPQPESVATLAELPHILGRGGVPWNVNGRTTGVDPQIVTIVARIDQASVVDQVAMVRDTVRGYAWLDRQGVLQVWDTDHLSSAVAAVLDETDYRDLDTGFDPATSINTVTIKATRIDPATGETEEVTYGPFVDGEAPRTWGPQPAEFTVLGLDEDEVADYAASVLADAATPRVRVNALTLPLRTTADVAQHVTRDLYDLVTVTNERADLDVDLRVVSVKHRITGTRWFVDLGFAPDSSVAPPQVTPSPASNSGPTLAQRLRPVGEVTMFYGAVSAIPAGWLRCDGTNFDASTYPKLQAFLGSTTLPNLVDRFPIGAGNKALGAQGGSPTVVLAPGNYRHTHVATQTAAAAIPRGTGTADAAPRAHQHSVGEPVTSESANVPVDVLNPWRAVHFIIRAA